jgi:hypothetical protein
MKVKFITKINKLGDLKFCIINKDIQINNEFQVYLNNNLFDKTIYENKYYKIYNIEKTKIINNKIPLNFKNNIDEKIKVVEDILEKNDIKIIEKDIRIQYQNSPILRSQRTSCENCKLFNCF